MIMRILAVITLALILGRQTYAESANYTIDNSAGKISSPAEKIYNPAADIKNPAANIYNPATQMDNPNPLSPVSQPVAQSVGAKETAAIIYSEQLKVPPHPQAKPQAPHKNYHYKSVRAYVTAAKNAFSRDDYVGFISITEDALRRIEAGTLVASDKTKQKLVKYKTFGNGMMEKSGE